MKLNDDNEKELEDVVAKAEKVPIYSIPIFGAEGKYSYMRDMREWIKSLKEGEAIKLYAPNRKVADRLRSRWAQLAKENQPHTRKIKQNDGSYFVYLWLGGTTIDALYKIGKEAAERRTMVDNIVKETISKYSDKQT